MPAAASWFRYMAGTPMRRPASCAMLVIASAMSYGRARHEVQELMDDQLGKTAQLIGSLLSDPAEGPTLVVCPVSMLCWPPLATCLLHALPSQNLSS